MRFEDKEILISNNADQLKTLKHIDKIAEEGKLHPFIQESIKRYGFKNDLESIRAIFNAGFKIATFQPDPEGQQYIRTVNRLLKDRRGNCVDYTVFLSAFMRALEIPHFIRMVSFDPENPRSYQHIYPLTINGIILDPVFGQDQTGQEFKKDPEERIPYFNREVPYFGKFDKMISA